jgi:hypothetical protein
MIVEQKFFFHYQEGADSKLRRNIDNSFVRQKNTIVIVNAVKILNRTFENNFIIPNEMLSS